MSNRIVTQGCTKCGGAIKEEAEVGEWSCMNCGMLFLPEKSTKVRETSRPPTFKEDTEETPEGKSTLDSLSEVPRLEPEDLGDDLEWERLNPQLKSVSEDEWLGNYNICKQCGKKGLYTYIPIVNKEYDETLRKNYCKFCHPRRPWKGKFEKEFLR